MMPAIAINLRTQPRNIPRGKYLTDGKFDASKWHRDLYDTVYTAPQTLQELDALLTQARRLP